MRIVLKRNVKEKMSYTQELQGIPQGNRYQINGGNHTEVRNMSQSTQEVNGQTVPNDATKLRFREIFNRPSNDWFHIDEL